MNLRALITCPQMLRHADEFVTRLAAVGVTADAPDVLQQLTEGELLEIIDRYDGTIAGDDPYTARVIAKAERLRVIAKWGVGVDNIDLEAAAARGIRVVNTPGAFGDEVADVTIGYVIMLARQLHRTDALVRLGEWPKIRGFSLAGRTLGVVGLGAIGQAVVRRAVAHELLVVGHDIVGAQAERAAHLGAKTLPLADVLAQSDIVALCCPLTDETRHLMDDRAFATIRPGSYLVNAARGALVDEQALIRALQTGRIAGAALDVYESEPLAEDSPLRELDSVILGAHNASNTDEAVQRVNEQALSNLLEGLGVTA